MLEGRSGAETIELQRGLAQVYPGTAVRIGWINGFRRLHVTLDGATFRALPDTAVVATAQSVARVALRYFPPSRQLDSITVTFVTASNGLLIKSTRSLGSTFSVASLR